MSLFVKYASVLLDISIDKLLDYGITKEQSPKIRRGSRVEVYVKGKLRKGFVYEIKEKCDYSKVLPITTISYEEELIPKELFELGVWMSRYYCAPLRKVFKTMVPSSIRNNIQEKKQLYVTRAKTREQLRKECEKLRRHYPSQAKALDIMLKTKKGILLTKLLESAAVSKSPILSLSEKGLLKLDNVCIDRSPLSGEEYFRSSHKTLNEEQKKALDKIHSSINKGCFETHLLYGITGSGKTEVYLQAIDKALNMGKGSIMLVPEISLTPQTVERFRSRFQEYIAILHHRLSAGERYDEWHKIRKGEARIVIGARSAIFSPVSNLSLIIIDEEHESSYKQSEESPCYHARDIAVMRAYLNKQTVVLGTATPCLESFFNAKNKKYTFSRLSQRADSAKLPSISIVDMQKEYEQSKGYAIFSDLLLREIKKRLTEGEQIIIFLNRRGYHTLQICLSCNTAIKCPHCDITLTFHYNENTLSCHFCHYALSPPPLQCPSCGSFEHMKYRGVGTEQAERALHAIFPEIRTLRLDADTTRHKGSHEKLLSKFRNGKADAMIGTQMIAKGLHFPQVTLVGILNSDASLNIPDFRSSERVFQLLMQVSGRAGRGFLPGKVIIQTRSPENSVIQLAAKQSYLQFYKEEIASREIFDFPPFSHIVKFSFSGINEKITADYARRYHRLFASFLPPSYKTSPVSPSGHAKIKKRFRFQFFSRGKSVYRMNQRAEETREKLTLPRDVRLSIDVDPLSIFF